MDLSADEVIERILSGKAHEVLSDDCIVNELELKLPKWYDKEKFTRGQKYFHHNLFTMFMTMLSGLITVLAIPSIIAVLVETKRSAVPYTAYKRYISTILHVMTWFNEPLEPGSVPWRSLEAVRTRHLRASLQCVKKGGATSAGVSQRDLAITLFGFMGYSVTKSKVLNMTKFDDADANDMLHVWAVIGHMIGLKDEFNVCRPNYEDTLKVCRAISENICAPCLQNVPEHFIHMTDTLLDGMWSFNPNLDFNSYIYFTRYLAEVPGYVYTKTDLRNYKKKLETIVNNNKAEHETADTEEKKPFPTLKQPAHNPSDFNDLTTVPAYKKLTWYEKYRLNFIFLAQLTLNNTAWGRWYLNMQLYVSLWLIKNIPFLAYVRYGFKKSHVNIFRETDAIRCEVKKNCDMIVKKCWYEKFLRFDYYSDYIVKDS